MTPERLPAVFAESTNVSGELLEDDGVKLKLHIALPARAAAFDGDTRNYGIALVMDGR